MESGAQSHTAGKWQSCDLDPVPNDSKARCPLSFTHCYRLTSASCPKWPLVQALPHCHWFILEVHRWAKRWAGVTTARAGQQSLTVIEHPTQIPPKESRSYGNHLLLAPSPASTISVYDTFLQNSQFWKKPKDLCMHYCMGLISITSESCSFVNPYWENYYMLKFNIMIESDIYL